MEALSSSSTKFLAKTHRSVSSPSNFLRKPKPEIRFFPSQKTANHHLEFSYSGGSLQQFISVLVSSSSQADLESAEPEYVEVPPEAKGQSKTLHVRLQLQKECMFGEEFFVAGDDPMFGLWDPESAIPLEWSEGHLWTAELDIPIGKTILFKFILKGLANNIIIWQPNPDRVLQTYETNKTITVLENWEDASLQMIVEEPVASSDQHMMDKPEEESSKNEESIITENVTSEPEEEPNENGESIMAKNVTYTEEEAVSNVLKTSVFKEDKTNSKEAHTKEETVSVKNVFPGNGAVVTEKKATYPEEDETLIEYKGEPVLVPGLNAMPVMTTEEVFIKELENRSGVSAFSGADESTANSMPENHRNEEFDGNIQQEQTTVRMQDSDGLKEENQVNEPKEHSHLIEEREKPDHNIVANDLQWSSILSKDFQWGHATVRKVLEILGFPLQNYCNFGRKKLASLRHPVVCYILYSLSDSKTGVILLLCVLFFLGCHLSEIECTAAQFTIETACIYNLLFLFFLPSCNNTKVSSSNCHNTAESEELTTYSITPIFYVILSLFLL